MQDPWVGQPAREQSRQPRFGKPSPLAPAAKSPPPVLLDPLPKSLQSGHIAGNRMVLNPVGARHDLRSREAKIGAGDQGLDGREAVETGAGLSYGVTERYGAGY